MTLTPPQALQLAIQQHQSGELSSAETLYRQVLQVQPDNADALHLLGLIALHWNNYDEAMDLIQQAIRLNHAVPNYYNSLGSVLKAQGQLTEARVNYQRAVTLDANFADACRNLGEVLKEQRQLTEAITYLQRALSLSPQDALTYALLGDVFLEQQRQEEAISYYQQAIALNPNFAEAYHNLGTVFLSQSKWEEAETCFRHAIELNPNFADAYNNLGTVLFIDPSQFAEAAACFQQALTLNANLAEAHANLGLVSYYRGMIQTAIEHLRRALQIKPTAADFHTGLLFMLNYLTDYDPAMIRSEYQQFHEQCAKPLITTLKPHLNHRQVQRRLKIGYMSPDFRQHSIAYFIEPILAHHDHQHFEIFCYHNSLQVDEVTSRLQQYSDHWLNCTTLSDEQLAEAIRQDSLDILIDLAGHTKHNRLLVFARKPAPVQVTYLGYPGTTGLLTMDYRITDAYTDPVGVTDQWSAETLVRMSPTYFCYQPAAETHSLLVNPLPVLQNGYLTFGSFNNYPKLSEDLLKLWANLLMAIPNSKLLLKSESFQDAMARQSLVERFSSLGIVPEQLRWSPFAPTLTDHLRKYQYLDIALDSYPYNGATTTCEALWMGVPVVTLVGNRHASRMGLSILSALGLTELIAYTEAEYINICLKLANDIEYLQHLRATLRHRMQTSPLMDAASFTRQLETAYRNMWEKWCIPHSSSLQ